jgi:cell division protein FtsB
MANEQRTIEDLENEIETLKSANRKLSKEIECYKQQNITSSPNKLKLQLQCDTSFSENENESDANTSKNLFSLIHVKKLKEDNISLKLEVEKLYDEIDSMEK